MRKPRRIFRGNSIASGPSFNGGLGRTLAVGLVGTGMAAAMLLLAAPADLFGRVPALSGHLAAPARLTAVVDGQTLRLRETVLRLKDVEAPARGTLCDGQDCGAAASQRLANLIGTRDVSCQLDGRDAAGMAQALCFAGDILLNQAMIQPRARP